MEEKRLQREAETELRQKELAWREKEIELSENMNMVPMAEVERGIRQEKIQ